MPFYDYTCENGHIVEVMHGVHDSGPSECERCGAGMRKLLSTPAIVFKGSGWAKKDRSSKPANKEKPATDSEAKPATDSEAKPATDSEAKPSTPSDVPSTKSGTDSAASEPKA